MNVDMASYKAEFLSHHYQGRLRPRQAYAMGLIMVWARLASLVQWGDYLSLYLALDSGVDPTPIASIDEFKRRLAEVEH